MMVRDERMLRGVSMARGDYEGCEYGEGRW